MNYKLLVPLARGTNAPLLNKGVVIFPTAINNTFQPFFYNADGTTFEGPVISLAQSYHSSVRQKPLEFPITIAGYTGSSGLTAYLVY